jgi:hypothetical protein
MTEQPCPACLAELCRRGVRGSWALSELSPHYLISELGGSGGVKEAIVLPSMSPVDILSFLCAHSKQASRCHAAQQEIATARYSVVLFDRYCAPCLASGNQSAQGGGPSQNGWVGLRGTSGYISPLHAARRTGQQGMASSFRSGRACSSSRRQLSMGNIGSATERNIEEAADPGFVCGVPNGVGPKSHPLIRHFTLLPGHVLDLGEHNLQTRACGKFCLERIVTWRNQRPEVPQGAARTLK